MTVSDRLAAPTGGQAPAATTDEANAISGRLHDLEVHWKSLNDQQKAVAPLLERLENELKELEADVSAKRMTLDGMVADEAVKVLEVNASVN